MPQVSPQTTVPSATVDTVMAWMPLCSRDQVEALFAGRERMTCADILDAEIPAIDRVWVALHFLPDAKRHEFGCVVAEGALAEVDNPDPRSIEAIKVKRMWLRGEATDAELAAARSAVGRAARSAASAAAWAVASTASWAAASSADRPAWEASRSAAEAAALAAASAVDMGSWEAAWAAAWAAALDVQIEWLRKAVMARVSLKNQPLMDNAVRAAVADFCERCADVPYRDESGDEIACHSCPLAVLAYDQERLNQVDNESDEDDHAHS